MGSKHKATIVEHEELKDKYIEMKKEKKDIERKYSSMKKVYQHTKILSEQTKAKVKNLHQEKEISVEVLQA